ncbi:GNAT superfamily N-acetyltransferase [Caballeronia udeis]|uniref:GNAT superfamily N-acetyltransferase n=1 Tax=Caballeronia udeis TaxID=1232866 RepID=A0ABW8MQ48_9BURK
MKHLSLLALLPSGAAVSTATGSHAVPGAPDLAAYVLSHERYDADENAPSARKDYKNVHVADVMTDEYVFPLGETGKSIVLSGYQIAAGFLAERAADAWLELARQQHVENGGAQGDGTRHVPDPAEADQLMDRAMESAERILAPFETAPVASLFETHYRGAREFLRLSWEGLPEDLVPKSRRPAVVLKTATDPAPVTAATAAQDYDPYGLEGTSDYDVDKPLAYREKIGPFLLTMTYRHEYPQVDDERLGTAFAVFHEAGTDIVAAAVELKLVKVPPIHSSADLVYVLDTYSGEMLSLALAATEALGPERLCSVFNTHRVVYISTWEVRKQWRGQGLGVALLREALQRLPADPDGRPDALCVAPEPYQTEARYLGQLPPALRAEIDVPAQRLTRHLTEWLDRANLPNVKTHFFIPMAKHEGIGSAGENARLIDRIMESEA